MVSPVSEQVSAQAESELPPGFLDEAPPGPESDTLVLSGGMLMSTPPIADSVVVITQGKVVSWGARGETDMPDDSIGHDMRGKWLLPKVSLKTGETANIDIYSEFPKDPNNIVGQVRGTSLNLPPAED